VLRRAIREEQERQVVVPSCVSWREMVMDLIVTERRVESNRILLPQIAGEPMVSTTAYTDRLVRWCVKTATIKITLELIPLNGQ
jgi:hypothetical protein